MWKRYLHHIHPYCFLLYLYDISGHPISESKWLVIVLYKITHDYPLFLKYINSLNIQE